MRRILGLVAVAGAVLAVSACEPAMTITAHPSEGQPLTCDSWQVTGKVSPASATPKVVLQMTVKGKWVDAKAPATFDAPHTVRSANVSQSTGGYAINVQYVWSYTQHFRVRSNGGGAVSPSFYVTAGGSDGSC